MKATNFPSIRLQLILPSQNNPSFLTAILETNHRRALSGRISFITCFKRLRPQLQESSPVPLGEQVARAAFRTRGTKVTSMRFPNIPACVQFRNNPAQHTYAIKRPRAVFPAMIPPRFESPPRDLAPTNDSLCSEFCPLHQAALVPALHRPSSRRWKFP